MRWSRPVAAGLLVLALALAGCGTMRPPHRQMDDAVMAQNIHEALWSDPELSNFEITIDVRSGDVTITGVVRSEEQRRKAEEIIRGIPKVKSVRNLLGLQKV